MPRKATGKPPGRPRKNKTEPSNESPPTPSTSNGVSGKVLPFGRPVTMGEVLDGLRKAAPASTPNGVETSQPASLFADSPPASIADALPPTPPALEPELGEDNTTFCRIAASAATTVVVLVAQDAIRKSGYEPNDPDSDDIDDVNEHTAAAFARAIGDKAVPWWAPLLIGYGNLIAAMRLGAQRIEKGDLESMRAASPKPPTEPAAPPPAATPPSAARVTSQSAGGVVPTGKREPIRRVA